MFSKRSGWRAVAALALSLSVPASASEPAETSPSDDVPTVLLEELVVKSSRPPGVDALEAREVRETPARDLGEALDASAQLGKVRKGGIANDVVLRGMKRDDVNVLVDGAAVHGACPSRMDPPAFHLDWAEVDRVEVRRGPFDVSNPGGLGGLVDVRTRRAAHPGAGGELHLGYGAFRALESSAVLAWAARRVDLAAGGALKRGRPYASGDGRNFTLAVPAVLGGAPNGARFRDTSGGQDAYDVRTGWAKLGVATGAGGRLEVAYTRQSARDVLYPFLAMDGTVDDTDRVNATWRSGALGPLSTAAAQVFWSAVEHDMDDRGRCSAARDVAACGGELPRGWSMRTVARSSVVGGKVEGELAGAGLRAGADFRLRRWDNTTTRLARAAPGAPYLDEASIPDVRIADAGAFAEVQRPLPARLRASAGARVDVAGTRAREDRTALYATYRPGGDVARARTDLLVSGNVRLEWEVAPEVLVHAGFGHAARTPDPQERYMALSTLTASRPAWIGNPALRPASRDEVDLGARWAARGVLLTAQVFHAWLGDAITLADLRVVRDGTAATARTYENVAARSMGGEASARVALPAHLFATAAVAFTWARNEARGVPLAEIPPLGATVALRWDERGKFVQVEEQVAARQSRVDRALGEEPTPAWWITNLRAGVDVGGVRLLAGVRNLFDRSYAEHLSYQRDPFASGTRVPEPGRVVYANAQYAF